VSSTKDYKKTARGSAGEEITMYETVAAMGLLGLVMSFMMGWAVWYFLTLVA
jgi:hypothetical protein